MLVSRSPRFKVLSRVWQMPWPPVVAILAVAFIAGFATRAFAQGATATYFSACLNTNSGALSDVAIGTAPLNPCRPNQTPITWSDGDIHRVIGGVGLTEFGDSGDVLLDLDSIYRLPQTCVNGQVAKWNTGTLTWECAADNDTTYSAGTGLTLNGTEFSADTTYLQRRVSATCPTGESIRAINSDGSVVCQPDTNTTYSAGPGLGLSNNEFSVSFAGTGSANTAARSDHTHPITGTITANLMGGDPACCKFGVLLPSSGGSNVVYTFMVPYDYAGGPLTVREWYREHDMSGTARILLTYSKLGRDGSGVNLVFQRDFNWSTVPNVVQRIWDIPAVEVAPGDIFWVQLERQGDHPDDTMGRLDLRAVGVEYQANQ